jgi:hypothetical protein
MRFKITPEDVFVDNPELLCIEEFKDLPSREFKYVAFFVDYDSPFRGLPSKEKRIQAAQAAGFRLEKGTTRLDKNGRDTVGGKIPRVLTAIAKYNKLQKDINREIIVALDCQIEQFLEFLLKKDKNSLEQRNAMAITEKLPVILENRKRIIGILSLRDNEVQDGDESVTEFRSTIDEVNIEEQI